MDALELLLNRSSYARLTDPAPSEEELKNILQAGLRAPDHGRLTPWRFISVRGNGSERLSSIFRKAAGELGVTEDKAKKMPLRAPLIIIAVSSPVPHFKIPRLDQILSTGSALTLMQLTAVAQGYQGIWRTGPAIDSKIIKEELGLDEHEEITGFLYIGTPANTPPDKSDHELGDYITELD